MGWRSTRTRAARGGGHLPPGPARRTAAARGRRAERRYAAGCAAGFLGLLVLLDWGAGTLTLPRSALWTAGAAVVLAVLWPPLVVAGDGWLAVRGLLRTRGVRTDALTGVERSGQVAVSLVLRDAYGGRVELSAGVLEANPLLWHLVDTGVRRSRARGTLRAGARVAGGVSERVDAAAAEILRASGLR